MDFDLNVLKEIGIGVGSAWLVAKTLLKMYLTKDTVLMETMNARIEDAHNHIRSCNDQNVIFMNELFNIKEKISGS